MESQQDTNESVDNVVGVCLVCKKNPMEYSCVPCGCNTLCKSCAMKQASGGKCKVCKEMFAELRRINVSN
ncbi:hypothetical protein BC833DRAFT_524964 [Globomyces pollinis-pini]|nr:hypothetical protein BC833DRAFT_524964 [Globomyces pollinis-pini]